MFLTAAEQDHADAQFYLGHMYRTGRAVDEDPAEALRWIRRAADRGFALAQHQLGRLYLEGYAVPANPDTAFAWFARATKTKDPDMRSTVGELFASHADIAHDPVHAYALNLAAIALGENRAKVCREELTKGLSPDDIARAHALLTSPDPRRPH